MVKIGVLALQGAFEEHLRILRSLGAEVSEVRLPDQFEGLDGVVLPGGESTAMALIGERWGVFPKLKEWVEAGRPAWGTCAGLILLSDAALLQKEGGQSLIGGLDVEVCRNYFGSQVSSFEQLIGAPEIKNEAKEAGSADAAEAPPLPSFPAVFIRAPAILKAGPTVKVLATVRALPCSQATRNLRKLYEGNTAATASAGADATKATSSSEAAAAAAQKELRYLEPFLAETDGGTVSAEILPEVIVAVQKGAILGTAFHPELTNDFRWHEYFLSMVEKHRSSSGSSNGVPFSDGKKASFSTKLSSKFWT